MHGTPFCIGHNPAITAEMRMAWRKKPHVWKGGRGTKYYTREEVLEILSRRLKLWHDKYENIVDAQADQAICDLARTYAYVTKAEVAEGASIRGWRMKGSG